MCIIDTMEEVYMRERVAGHKTAALALAGIVSLRSKMRPAQNASWLVCKKSMNALSFSRLAER
jgi:threonine dehydratase